MSRLTCTDCIHDYVCHNLNNLNYWNKDDPNGDPMDKFCLCFKNKELFIELPCKVGDTVYDIAEFIDKYDHPEIFKINVEWITITADKDDRLCFDLNGFVYHLEDFGRIIFLTKAEAEAKLAEQKDGGGDEKN